MEEERKNTEEKLALLNESKKELTSQFKSLAQEIFEENSKKFTEQNHSKLGTLLTPFREQLKDFKQKVEDIYVNEGKDRASLKKEIESMCNLHQKFNKEAINLTRALKGDRKAQGAWGELILETVLEQSGLRKGVEYEAQGSFRDGENKLLKPDVVVHLPEGKDILVDSKVSLSAYEKYCSTENDIERQGFLKAHIKAVRNHIAALSEKDYTDLKGLRSLDFVLLFIPIEPAFTAAFQNDEKLYSEAFEKRIIIVTPTTLLVTLRTIKSIWQFEQQNQNARRIAEQAGAVYNKLRGFVEVMEKLGKQVSMVSGTYDDAMAKLTHGQGNLIYQANRFVELGVKVKKELPRSVTEISE